MFEPHDRLYCHKSRGTPFLEYLEKSAVLEIADFWSRYAFVELDLENEKVKLNPDTQRLLALAEAAEIPSPPTVEEPVALVIQGVIKSVEPVGKTELKISGEKLRVNWGPKLEAVEVPQEIVPVRALRLKPHCESV